jgi:hypothetical protein
MVSPVLSVRGRESRGMGNVFLTSETRASIFLSSQEMVRRPPRKVSSKAERTTRKVLFLEEFCLPAFPDERELRLIFDEGRLIWKLGVQGRTDEQSL